MAKKNITENDMVLESLFGITNSPKKVPKDFLENLMDFYDILSETLKTGLDEDFFDFLSADKDIKLSVSPKIVTITPYAFYESESKRQSLEYIMKKTFRHNVEVPFAGIIDEKNLIVSEFIRGTGEGGGDCDWFHGSLLEKSFKQAEKAGYKVSLGHTHPKGFGAICSDVPYSQRELKRELRLKGKHPLIERMLETKICEKHLGDYACMFTMAYDMDTSLISKYFWILAPGEFQIGLFEVLPKGKIVYHPLKIQE